MAGTVQIWRAATLVTLAAVFALALFLLVRPLHIDSPASSRARALLRLDSALGATVEPVESDSLVVTSVASHGPAASAGIHVGDVIRRIGGQPALAIRDGTALTSPSSVAVVREGRVTVVSVPIAARHSS